MKNIAIVLNCLFVVASLLAQYKDPVIDRSNHSVQSYSEDAHYTFVKADFVGIIKATGYDGWYRHWFINTKEYKWGADIHRYKAEVVLPLKGTTKGKDIIICIDIDPVVEEPEDKYTRLPLNFEFDYPIGKLFLVYLYHPREDKTIESGSSRSYRITLKSVDDFYMPAAARDGYNLFPLPDCEYTIEGNTSVEKAAMILTQAFEKDGFIGHAASITRFSPGFMMRDGKRFMYPLDGESPEFYDFYSEKIEPRLLKKAGENLIYRLYILAMSVNIGKEERRLEYESLLWQIDETYPDPDAEIGLPVIFKHENRHSFIMLLANARLAYLRGYAIERMIADDNFPDIKVHKSQVIKMLDDPNKRVRTKAIRYLTFTVKDPNQPKPIFKGMDSVENEQEIIEYWKGKGDGKFFYPSTGNAVLP